MLFMGKAASIFSRELISRSNDSDCDGGIKLYVKGIYGSVSFEKAYA